MEEEGCLPRGAESLIRWVFVMCGDRPLWCWSGKESERVRFAYCMLYNRQLLSISLLIRNFSQDPEGWREANTITEISKEQTKGTERSPEARCKREGSPKRVGE